MPRPVAPACRTIGGIATRAQLRAAGVSGGDITAAVRLGEIRRIRRAHYAVPDADPDAVFAVRVGGRLCGPSAARSYGLWAGDAPQLHVAVAPNASRLRIVRAETGPVVDIAGRPVRVHWVPTDPHPECWRVSFSECLQQMATWSDRETAIACLDTALASGMTSDRLRALFEDASPLARGRANAARVGSDSGLESIVRQRLAGLPVRQQVTIEGVGRVDMVIGRVVIEVDGGAFHRTATAFDEDRRRDAELAARGYVVIRLTYERIMTDWAWCRSRVLAALESFPGEPTTVSSGRPL